MKFVYTRLNIHHKAYEQHLRDFRIAFGVILFSVMTPPLNELYYFSLIHKLFHFLHCSVAAGSSG